MCGPVMRVTGITLLLTLAACATSPLYRDDPSSGYGTVPRDELGEPIWDLIEPKEGHETDATTPVSKR